MKRVSECRGQGIVPDTDLELHAFVRTVFRGERMLRVDGSRDQGMKVRYCVTLAASCHVVSSDCSLSEAG